MTAPKLPPNPLAPVPAAPEQFLGDYTADLRRTWYALVERAWIITLCLVIFLAVGAAYLRSLPVLYSSTATVAVEQDQQRFLKLGNDNYQSEDVQSLDFLQTIAQSLKARPLLERVTDTNNLAQDRSFLAWTNELPSRDQLARVLDGMVNVKLRRGTRLIDVTVVDKRPEFTSKIANSIVRQYLTDSAERHFTTTELANELLLKEAERLKKKLEESEHALQAYKEQSNASSLDERQNTVVAELKELSTKATEAKSLRIKAETDYRQMIELGTNIPALLTLSAVASDPAVVASLVNRSKAEDDFAALRQRYKAKHPKYIQAESQLLALDADIAQNVLKATEKLKSNLDGARAAEEALDNARKTQEASALQLSRLAIQYTVLSREVDSDRALYDSVLNRMKETSVTKEMGPNGIRIVQPAYVPVKPFSPSKTLILALSGMGGLFIGLLIALALNFLDTSIKTVDEAEALLRLPVLAVIPRLKEAKRSPLVIVDGPRTAGAEGFRTLRTALSMLGRVEDRRVFLFTSALPQEGKTFSAINYAAGLAQLGLKTLLIDGDLRRPSIEIAFKGRGSIPSLGVTDYLIGETPFNKLVQPTKLESLFYIPAGSTAPNPAEMLAQDGLDHLIEEALKEYDRVVIDSAPIHVVSDTLLMVRCVQTVCLVVQAARSSSRSVFRSVQLLQSAGAPLSGVLLNRVPLHRSLGYSYSPYYDNNSQGQYARTGVYGEA
jgi:capsular exopolysaccharide synthesis family protein